MRNFLPILFLFLFTGMQAQNQPGLHVEKNHTVLFGQDTTTHALKTMWLPSKGAFRSGKISSNGMNNSNIGNVSAAFGGDTQATGNYSFTTGFTTTANSFAEFSIGQWSLGGGNKGNWDTAGSDVVFEIGNGIGSSSKSNMFTVQKNGNVKIGDMTVATDIIDEKLVVDGGVVIGDNIDNTPSPGTIRWNSSISNFEGFTGTSWETLTTNDDDPNNEIEIPAGGLDGHVLATDGSGNYSWAASSRSIPDGAMPIYGVGYIGKDETKALYFKRYDGFGFSKVPSGKYVIIMEYSIAPVNIIASGNYYCNFGPNSVVSSNSDHRRHVFNAQTQVQVSGNIAPIWAVRPNHYVIGKNSSASSGSIQVSVSGFLVNDLSY